MTRLPLQGRTLALASVLIVLAALFVVVVTRSGPLAPVAVTVATVESSALAPGLFGVGTVESRYTYKIGPTLSGRLLRVVVDVGDRVAAGQLLAEMDAVDLDDRVRAQQAILRRSEALLQESEARQGYALAQATRYEQLLAARSTSEELLSARQQDRRLADAALVAAREEVTRARAEHDALRAQRNNLRLVAPVAGLIASRSADPGTTIVTGQAVVEVVDPRSLWVHVRVDQGNAHGLRAGLPALVVLRSRDGKPLSARVLRVEPRADAVTEETLVKVVFESMPDPLPPIGELAEVTVSLPSVPSAPVIANAAVHRINGSTGVWQVVDGDLQFTPVSLGAANLDGLVQVRSGLSVGDRVVVYSAKSLSARSRIKVTDRLPGVPR